MAFGFSFGGLIFLLALLVVAAIRVLREYERGVVFMLGRFWRVKGPGLVLLIPGIQQMVRVDLRTVVFDVPPQDCDLSRQCVGQGQRSGLFPGRGPRAGHHPGGQLPRGHQPALPDHAAGPCSASMNWTKC